MAEAVRAKIVEEEREGVATAGGGRKGLQFQRLTYGFWRQNRRREVFLAGGEGPNGGGGFP